MSRYDIRRCFTAAEALGSVPGEKGEHSAELFRHGSLQVKVYAPVGEDNQTPHTKDEAYVVLRGNGVYVTEDNKRREVGEGDFCFAPAGSTHRFEDFSDGFAVWVIFYGPDGGE